MGTPDRWWTVCVAYHDERGTDDLILDAVRPLFGDLAASVDAAYHLRHWRRGPHLRLNVRTTREGLNEAVLPAVDRHVGGFLRARPSVSTRDFEALMPAYRRLAGVEQDDGPLRPIRPDNSIGVEPYDSRSRVLGSDEAARFMAAFHVAATPAAFAAAEQIRADGQRLWTAFELMAATAHTFSGGGLRLGYVSFRAHADIFLARHPDRVRLRTSWNRLARSAGPALRARLERVSSAPEGGGARAPWLAALRGVRDRGFALVDSGVLLGNRAAADPEPDGEPSDFLLSLLANEAYRDRMMPSAPFRRYRLALNLLYVHLTKLGIRPAERSMLGHVLADTVEDMYGVDAATLVAETSARLP